ncbi:MAG: sulfatase-like hydrolase/transferase, partial [Verrucomicrobia bacterium]|nr:sulfatase-like hydrolase/transferase [Verrucomicrobiota bacterium]
MKKITLLLLAVLLGAASVASSRAASRPNFLFILADDLGWSDLGCYGHAQIKTPNLDRMAKQGTLFTQFYVNGSVCSPSRCAFFTGQYPARQKIHGHYATPEQNTARGMSQFLDPKVPNAAALLKSAGYATAHVGTWQLASNSGGPEPGAYGFDFVGSGEKGGAGILADDPFYRAKSTELFVNEALKFIESNKDRSFLLYLSHYAVHTPLESKQELAEKYKAKAAGLPQAPEPRSVYGSYKTRQRQDHAVYAGMVQSVDESVGRVLQKLEELGLEQNT